MRMRVCEKANGWKCEWVNKLIYQLLGLFSTQLFQIFDNIVNFVN